MLQTAIDAYKIPISSTGRSLEDILADMNALVEERAERLALAERIRSILDRFWKSGRYACIDYDPCNGVCVLIKHDGTRAALSPERLDALFNPPSKRPQRPAPRPVR